jgi:hypothetical protein
MNTTDLSWGADCEGCGTRLNASRAEAAAEAAGDGPLICGSCRDEAKAWDLRQEVERIAGWLERDRREPDKTLCHVQSLRRALL